MEIGWPSEIMYKRIQSFGHFNHKEKFRVGEGTIFDRLADIFGQAISERCIIIKIERGTTNISDAATVVFMRKRTSIIRHSVKLAKGAGFVKFIGWKFLFPEEVHHDEPSGRTVLINTATDKGAGLTQELDSVLFSFETALETGLPRDGHENDSILLTAEYELKAPSLDSHAKDEMFFDISKPTKRLQIRVITSPSLFVVTPELSYQILDEASRLLDERAKFVVEPSAIQRNDGGEGGWIIQVNHPPLNSRFALLLDARILKPGSIAAAAS